MPNHSWLVTSSQAKCDGVALEVVAEAEVAQHLKEGVMAAGKADVFKVVVLAAGADALLRCGGARVVALLGAQKQVLELVHSGVGKQQRRIVGRHQRGGVHAAVPLRLKKAQKQFANFVSRAELHGYSSVTTCGGASENHLRWGQRKPPAVGPVKTTCGGPLLRIQDLGTSPRRFAHPNGEETRHGQIRIACNARGQAGQREGS